MQTFLPYPDFAKSAACLDTKRLGEQRVEARQIYNCITTGSAGWRNHPAVRMWRGYPLALACYHDIVILEWTSRGHNSTMAHLVSYAIDEVKARIERHDCRIPPWFNTLDFHASHRSNLLRKDPFWYGQFGWNEPDNLPYVWPV